MQTKLHEDQRAAPDIPVARSRFGRLLGKVYRQWRRQADVSFKELGLSDATHMPLMILYVEATPMRQKDLADALHLDTSSLVRILAQLRAKHLVDWTCDPTDKRTKCITLTPAGRTTARMILTKSLEVEETILADISEEELVITRKVLEKISRRFESFTG